VERLRADADRERQEHAAALDRTRAEATREREDLRAALDARAAALEEARTDLRARAERAEAELDELRGERDALRTELQEATAADAESADGKLVRRPGRPARGE
jgi:colicin import membrane protein